jgi:hypothetical protein
MATTRFYDDPERIAAFLELQTNAGRYALNAPANGCQMPYQEDVHMRLQRWGANLDKNAILLENELRGMNRPVVPKDAFIHVYQNMPREYADAAGNAFAAKYPTATPRTDESRATCPAWMFRDAEQNRWEAPFLNPQANIERVFPHNIQTRILEKDMFETQKYGF